MIINFNLFLCINMYTFYQIYYKKKLRKNYINNFIYLKKRMSSKKMRET